MKKMIATLVTACTLMQGTAWAQDNPQKPPPGTVVETRPANRLLGIAGLGTMAAGAAMMIPWAEGESWKLNGHDYCYSERTNEINFERGICGTTKPMIKAGLITVGAGALMTWLGYRHVTVTPQVDKNTVAATAAVKW